MILEELSEVSGADDIWESTLHHSADQNLQNLQTADLEDVNHHSWL